MKMFIRKEEQEVREVKFKGQIFSCPQASQSLEIKTSQSYKKNNKTHRSALETLTRSSLSLVLKEELKISETSRCCAAVHNIICNGPEMKFIALEKVRKAGLIITDVLLLEVKS